MLALFDCLGNRVAVYKDWRGARIGEARRKLKLWVLYDSLPIDKQRELNGVVYQFRALEIIVK